MICIEDNSLSEELRNQFGGLEGMTVFVSDMGMWNLRTSSAEEAAHLVVAHPEIDFVPQSFPPAPADACLFFQ
jgi:hypothetical protein